MNFSEWLASSAGTALLLSIIGWLGRHWITNRLSQAVGHEYNTKLAKYTEDLRADTEKQLAELRAKTDVVFEKFRVSIGPYSEKQFERYNDLWVALVELRDVMDDLWISANETNLNSFSDKLNKLFKNIEKSALLVEAGHYKKIVASLDVLANYQIGKRTVIDLRKHTGNNYVPNATEEINRLISENSTHRVALNAAMDELMGDMRKQINGTTALKTT